MIMTATVIRVSPNGLLVRDSETGQEVFVNFGNTRSFTPGEVIRITHNGVMTLSIPPQITAISIARVPQTPSQPQQSQTEIRSATILQIRRDALLVRDLSNSRQVIVNYAHAHHFCVGQRVRIQYDSIILGNPLQVNATDVRPMC